MTEIQKIPESERPRDGSPFPLELRDGVKTGIDQLLKQPRWRTLVGDEIEREKGELQRTAEELELDYANLERAFDAAQLEPLSDADWEAMTKLTHEENGRKMTSLRILVRIVTTRKFLMA